jgi:hypothetical protein
VVLGAAERLDALAVGDGALLDGAGDRRRADEADRRDVRVGEDALDRGPVAVDDVQHAIGEPRLRGQFGQPEGGRRVLLAGLENEGVAAGDGHREHPHRHHGREVERRDAGDHAQRLPDRRHVHPGGDLRGELALELLGDAAGQFHDLHAPGDLAERVGVHLAVLGGDEAGELVAVGVEQLAVPEKERGAAGE